MSEHNLIFNKSISKDASPEEISKLLFSAREALYRLSGKAEGIRYKHLIRDARVYMGTPGRGKEVDVLHVTMVAKWEGSLFGLPPETLKLRAKHQDDQLAGLVGEARAKNARDAFAKMKRDVEEARSRQVPLREMPGVETVKASDVSYSKMIVDEVQLARTSALSPTTSFEDVGGEK